MANLDRLLSIKGVWAAGQFNRDGSLVECKGELADEFKVMAARMCAHNTGLASMLADAFSAISEQEWTPLYCWAVAGPKYSIFVFGNLGVFMNTREVSFNEVLKALMEEAKAG